MKSICHFNENALSALPGILQAQKVQRVLLLLSPSRRFETEITAYLKDFETTIFAGAQVHVPQELVNQASALFEDTDFDAVISLGGGSTTGLAKALKLQHDFYFIAVPTSYAGSEMTSIYGIRQDGSKNTGRDEKVRPNEVVYDARLTQTLPLRQSITSLLNALAHPVAAMADPELNAELRQKALNCIADISLSLSDLLELPQSPRMRLNAFKAAAEAGQILDQAKMGTHHQLAHLFGGDLNLEHSALHALLLPHSLRYLAQTQPESYTAMAKASGQPDLPAFLFDTLQRAKAPRSLKALEVKPESFQTVLDKIEAPFKALARAAYLGRRPSVQIRHLDWGLTEPVAFSGPEPDEARLTVLAIHGRGATADGLVGRIQEISGQAQDIAIVAPQAPENVWYAGGYNSPLKELEPALDKALALIQSLVEKLLKQTPAERIVLFGFSQGACLLSEYLCRHPQNFAGLIALSGARIGENWQSCTPDLKTLSILLGVAENDPWVKAEDVQRSAEFFQSHGAQVTNLSAPGKEHRMTLAQRQAARAILLEQGPLQSQSGFGNHHESESLPGALPPDQNSPLPPPLGLYAEQINGSGFVAARHQNLRSWLYRIRPAAQHSAFEEVPDTLLSEDFSSPPNPNLLGYAPLEIPTEPSDFVSGLRSFGGAGSSTLRRGYALHLYVANRSMEEHAFYNSDGDFLLVPQSGELLLQTEMGLLSLAPGQIAILPRGIKFSVQLLENSARGYVAEVFGRHFELPERGPVGANGLTDARHFQAPVAWHEDRLAPGYRLSTKFSGRLFQAQQDYSPYDVVAWHGNYTPYVYDLKHFSPVSNVRFDHPDPSIYTVLSAAMDELGSHSLDFVYFPPRWDVTEHTFRPPFFHRNATTEFNGIVKDPAGDKEPFYAGGYFLTPAMTAHGIRNRGVERILKQDAEDLKPVRMRESSLWFQFETALPLQLTPWGANSDNRIQDWASVWGAYPSHFEV